MRLVNKYAKKNLSLLSNVHQCFSLAFEQYIGKFVPGLLRGMKDDRLAIVITSNAPIIDSSSGKNQAGAVHEHLVD